MKVVERVITGPFSYILVYQEGGDKTRGFEYEFDKEYHRYKVLGLKDRQILEEFLDTKGRRKRIIFREEMLFQLQDVYVCESCNDNMVSKGWDSGYQEGVGYYDEIRYYECEKCGGKYKEKNTYYTPVDEW